MFEGTVAVRNENSSRKDLTLKNAEMGGDCRITEILKILELKNLGSFEMLFSLQISSCRFTFAASLGNISPFKKITLL